MPLVTRSTRWSFGSGGLVYGVVENAHYFVLVYYSQVLGLSPQLADEVFRDVPQRLGAIFNQYIVMARVNSFTKTP